MRISKFYLSLLILSKTRWFGFQWFLTTSEADFKICSHRHSKIFESILIKICSKNIGTKNVLFLRGSEQVQIRSTKWCGDNKSLTKQTYSCNILMFMVIHVTKLGSYGTISLSFESIENVFMWMACFLRNDKSKVKLLQETNKDWFVAVVLTNRIVVS